MKEIPAVAITCDCRPPHEDGTERRPLHLGDLAVVDGHLRANVGVGDYIPDAGAHRSVWVDDFHETSVVDGVESTRAWYLANAECPSCGDKFELSGETMVRAVEALYADGTDTITLRTLIAAFT